MAYQLKSLAINDQITGTAFGSADVLYTATNVTAQIDMATAYNNDGSAVIITVFILDSGQSAAADNEITNVSVPAGDSVILTELIGHKVPSGGTIEAFAGTTNVIRVTISGGEQI